MKKYRAKMRKDGKYGEYHESQKARMAEKRTTLKTSPQELPEEDRNTALTMIRDKEADRKRKYRHEKSRQLQQQLQNAVNTVSPLAFKSNSAEGKAVSRARKNLPFSPEKRRHIVKTLAFAEMKIRPFTSSKRKRKTEEKEAREKAVVEFYKRDDISRQAPGKNDVVSVKCAYGGKRQKLQKRHLTMSLTIEAYSLWKAEHPNLKVGKSRFAELRPEYVKLTGELPRNVCVCIYHGNFILLLEALHRYDSSIPLYSENFTSTVVCTNGILESCFTNECLLCKDGKVFKSTYPLQKQFHAYFSSSGSDTDDLSDDDGKVKHVKWWQWENVEGEDGYRDTLEKVMKRGTPEELYQCVVQKLPTFLHHHYIKRTQSQVYVELSKRVKKDDSLAMIQMDFAGNYSTMWQDEVQSAHWTKKQVTLLTSVYWNGEVTKSNVVVSDDLTHTKSSIVTFLDALATKLLSKNVHTLHVWTDGPSSQFKNRFIVAILPWLAKKFDIDIHWHYFATSHGKGCVDGIGGMVKRMVAEKVRQRRSIVRDAKSFFDCTKILKSETGFFLITLEQISNFVKDEKINDIFDSAPDVKGIKRIHHVSVIDGVVATSMHSLNLIGDTADTTGDVIGDTADTTGDSSRNETTNSQRFEKSKTVKIIKGNFLGYYAVITNKSYGDEWEIKYFKSVFGKYVLNDKDIDSREEHEMKLVEVASVDTRNRHTFKE